ncbi:MAG: hypothetical protein IKJ97_07930 [Bacteroidaceae bacterium]|nr:hypothetical protein [Bacteroidaceae bacterium]
MKTSFEKDLLEAALMNLEDGKNKLRLNNFAYSARELTRHYLKRLAPDTEVLNAPWFKPNDPKKPKAITREQRIKYAIQGYLSDDFRENVLKIYLNEVSKNLRTSIDDLSKYTHVEPETFDVDITTVTDVSYNIMEDMYAEKHRIDQYVNVLATQLKAEGKDIADYSVEKVTNLHDKGYLAYFFSKGNATFNVDFKKGIVKIATEYALHCGMPREQLTEVLTISEDGKATNFSIPDYSMMFFCGHKDVAQIYTNAKFSHLGCLCYNPKKLL